MQCPVMETLLRKQVIDLMRPSLLQKIRLMKNGESVCISIVYQTRLHVMQKISFVKKLITCILAGLVIGASALRMGVTYFRTWVPIRSLSIIPLVAVVTAVVFMP